MKKSFTFKNYEVAGIEDTYDMQVKINHWELTIIEDGRKTVYMLEEENTQGITKEQAIEFVEAYMSMSIELEEK
jgi:hypothetical protein